MIGAGVLDLIYRRGKKWDLQVGASGCLLPGMKVKLVRPHGKTRKWELLGEFEIAMVNQGDRVVRFTEPLPEDARIGDLLVYEGDVFPHEVIVKPC